MDNSLILASASPRRLTLLNQLGLKPVVQPADIDESPLSGESADALVARLARTKCEAIESPVTVLAADTMVMQGTRIYGKPSSRAHGVDMLLTLAGSDHTVITAVCVKAGERLLEATVKTTVTFCPISSTDAERYWDTGEPLDKAGGYAVQGIGAAFVERINGSYSNVMGLPLFETAGLLTTAGMDLLQGPAAE